MDSKQIENDKILDQVDDVPSNIEAEKSILGALLNNNHNINKIADILTAQHFYIPLHRRIYQSIVKMHEKGLIATPVTLKNYFDKDEALVEVNIKAIDYLMRLSSNAASVINLYPYANDIYETSLRRELMNIGNSVVLEAHQHNVDVKAMDLVERAEQKLFKLASEGVSESGFENIKYSVLESLKRIESARKRGSDISGTTTGYIDLDKMLGGLQNSDLLILAARPSMGKTSLAVNIALNIADYYMKEKDLKLKKSVGVFSLEMSSEQLSNRLLAIKTGLDGSKVRSGNITNAEFEILLHETEYLSNLPIFIDDTPAITISALRTRARRLKRQHNLAVIVVDYLQLLRGTHKLGSDVNRVQEIGEISQGLKAIAKELDIPVIALSQLSRAVESRDDKRPQLSDLRESGNIEQDADVVMFIYREEYYLSRKMPNDNDLEKYAKWQSDMEHAKNIAEVLIAKQRNGPIGNVSLHFDTKTTGFSNLNRGIEILPS